MYDGLSRMKMGRFQYRRSDKTEDPSPQSTKDCYEKDLVVNPKFFDPPVKRREANFQIMCSFFFIRIVLL